MNTCFVKNIDGVETIRLRKNITVKHTEKVVINEETGETADVELVTYMPNDELLFADGWTVYVTPEITPEEIMMNAKRDKRMDIVNYDSSNEVNIFYIQDMPVWLDKNTRTGLKLRFEAEVAMKHENTTLWYENHNFTLPLNDAIAMLYAIEVYASQCYDNTQMHLANLDALDSLEAILEYDYQAGYPEKLRF